jgi:hypothetical protein
MSQFPWFFLPYLLSCECDDYRTSNDQLKIEDSSVTKKRSASFLFDEDSLFNNDDDGRLERQQCAVAASNIIRNFSFMQENETVMVQYRHCLETVFQCLEDQNRGKAINIVSLSVAYIYIFLLFLHVVYSPPLNCK